MRRRQNGIAYAGNALYCDKIPLSQIAEQTGTPVYIYSANRIAERVDQFETAFGSYPHLLCYAVKANSNIVLLRLLARQGTGFDIVSGGELYRVLKAGGQPSKTVFSGVGKTAEEIDYALKSNIMLFNCESESELRLLNDRAVRMKMQANAALRINPAVNAKTHPYIATGLNEHKFGIKMSIAEWLYRECNSLPGLRIIGISCHIGSQICSLTPFSEAVQKLVEMATRLRKDGFTVEYLDAGGGLAVPYRKEDTAPTIGDYTRNLLKCVRNSGLKLIIEPGRSIVADAGVLLTRVIHVKSNGKKKFVIVDAAMNDLIRPSLYGAYHEIRPVERMKSPMQKADLVGPVCETGDFFARDRLIPSVKPGNLLAILTVGAYGFVLSSNYNSRPRPVEVMVEGDQWKVVRQRESLKDLLRGEA
ncbi:MAG: diaminopimelate decarboxylase [Acidobacteria bacterium RIFCSPLOWO2_12_FULL_54_10]|nr:MAG: diaminopimelate decarboxylase [Acidobacteria bacterium RIFCSPLOWO2_12_FULL_54_10]